MKLSSLLGIIIGSFILVIIIAGLVIFIVAKSNTNALENESEINTYSYTSTNESENDEISGTSTISSINSSEINTNPYTSTNSSKNSSTNNTNPYASTISSINSSTNDTNSDTSTNNSENDEKQRICKKQEKQLESMIDNPPSTKTDSIIMDIYSSLTKQKCFISPYIMNKYLENQRK